MQDDENIDQVFYNIMGGLFVPYMNVYPIIKMTRFSINYFKNKLKTTDLQNVRDFWKASRHDELKENMQISIKGLLSKYSPVFPGDPNKKRDQFKEYRLKNEVSNIKFNDFDAKLSIASGQMIWRLEPYHPKEYPKSSIRYLGLYQGTVRNSIPVFMDEYFYYNFTKLFNKNDNSSSVQVKMSGTLIPCAQYSFTGTKELIYSLYLTKKNPYSYIKRICQADYLDGDIWIWIQENGENKIISRFLDLIDNDDFIKQCNSLKEEIKDGSTMMMQFDQYHKRIFPRQEFDIFKFIEKTRIHQVIEF